MPTPNNSDQNRFTVARELDVAGKHACERRPRIFARFGMLAGQDESGTHISFVTLNPHDAVAGSIVVAFAIVAQNEFVHQVAVWPEEFHVAEESRLAPKIRTLPFRQPQIDLVQMVLAVVTRDAFEIDPEKDPAGADGPLIICILVVDRALVRLVHVISLQEIAFSRCVSRAGRRRKDLAHEFSYG